jgi:hypothetical protein
MLTAVSVRYVQIPEVLLNKTCLIVLVSGGLIASSSKVVIAIRAAHGTDKSELSVGASVSVNYRN